MSLKNIKQIELPSIVECKSYEHYKEDKFFQSYI